MVGRGHYEDVVQVVFEAVSEGELGVGAGIGGAIEVDRCPALQVAVGAMFFGNALPCLAVPS